MPADNPLQGNHFKPLRPRDLEVLRWVCEQCFARTDHVSALIGRGEGVAQQTSRRLCDMGLLRRQRYIVGEPTWLLPTRAGLSAWGEGGPLRTPALGRLEHFAAINDVRLHVQRRMPEAEWIPERRLRRKRSEAGKGQHSHIPDGVVLAEGQRVAIEVELHHKSRRATEAVLRGHMRDYDATVYFCAREPLGLLTKLAASGRFPGLEVRELALLKEA